MPNYRRMYGEGGTFAFTLCLADRRRRTLTDRIDIIREAYRATCAARPFRTEAFCVLPDHLHAVWTLPEGDTDYPGRWRGFKLRVTNALGERIWQPRYWEHTIRSDEDFANHVNYVHYNPVKHGLVRDMDEWPHSTWHRWKRENGLTWEMPPEDMHL
ncbi:REP-associated tyrosine transposase [Parvularcula lutaonensis]|uniref:Transposase n=1 Tax=Parvularcula lutaonensis TaxID=491923 RepID=A0ABV7MGG0_9PROT|nr:transposase [Parvularcula lutaonensis]GGY55168.1 transposase [Parvularcula lutaonensis]